MRCTARALIFVMMAYVGVASAEDWAKPDAEILSLLKAEAFSQLDDRLTALYARYRADPSREREVDLAFDASYRSGPEIEKQLTAWIASEPKSHVAHLARGIHYTKMGWSRRGAAVMIETSKEQMDGMQYYFEKAWQDLEAALSKNPELVHAMCYEMEILMNFSAKDQILDLRKRALTVTPLSLTARWYYITTLLPRWGGSIAQVNQEIVAARKEYKRNSALGILDGRADAEMGDALLFAGRYDESIPYYTKARQYGEHWFYIEQRGEAYSYAGQPQPSNKDLDAAIRLRPNCPRAYYMRGFNEYAAGQYGNAIKDWEVSLSSSPFDAKTWNLRGDAYGRLGNPDYALRDVEKAAELEPANAEYVIDRDRQRAASKR